MNSSVKSIEKEIFDIAADWLLEEFDGLTSEMPTILPSEWAENNRYLSSTASAIPGLYSFEVTPYLKEILDCLAPSSPVRMVDLMKGVQIGATVGVQENFIGYTIAHTKNAPMMYLTADSELAKLRVEQYILPMLQDSNMMDLIKSNDVGNTRKTGKTSKRIEWVGGGFLLPVGANNPAKLRSVPIPILLMDEPDAYKDKIGRDGDPAALAEARTNTFEPTRKICALSTPLLRGSSRIHARYLQGDQRKYMVPCTKCKKKQELRWSGVDNETGAMYGMHWELDEDGMLIRDSVKYLCRFCGHGMVNSDKTEMLAQGEWVPTAKPVAKDRRSYHISALYSPSMMFSWASCVDAWLEAWDVENRRPRDVEKLQVFYNNILGEPFEQLAQNVSFSTLSAHRRKAYLMGQIPSEHAERYAGGILQMLTCAVDVQKNYLCVAVFGWTPAKVCYLVDYFQLQSEEETGVENIEDAPTWGVLRDFVENKTYKDDAGREYPIAITLVDSGHATSAVYDFCYQFADGHKLVFPLKGEDAISRGASHREFTAFKTKTGLLAYHVKVDFYKDRWGRSLRYFWDQTSPMRIWHFNAPTDTTDKQLKELTREVKSEVTNKETGKSMGYRWIKTAQKARNELWDLLCYNNAALEIFALQVCIDGNFEVLNWEYFFEQTKTGQFFYDIEVTDGNVLGTT